MVGPFPDHSYPNPNLHSISSVHQDCARIQGIGQTLDEGLGTVRVQVRQKVTFSEAEHIEISFEEVVEEGEGAGRRKVDEAAGDTLI